MLLDMNNFVEYLIRSVDFDFVHFFHMNKWTTIFKSDKFTKTIMTCIFISQTDATKYFLVPFLSWYIWMYFNTNSLKKLCLISNLNCNYITVYWEYYTLHSTRPVMKESLQKSADMKNLILRYMYMYHLFDNWHSNTQFEAKVPPHPHPHPYPHTVPHTQSHTYARTQCHTYSCLQVWLHVHEVMRSSATKEYP